MTATPSARESLPFGTGMMVYAPECFHCGLIHYVLRVDTGEKLADRFIFDPPITYEQLQESLKEAAGAAVSIYRV